MKNKLALGINRLYYESCHECGQGITMRKDELIDPEAHPIICQHCGYRWFSRISVSKDDPLFNNFDLQPGRL